MEASRKKDGRESLILGAAALILAPNPVRDFLQDYQRLADANRRLKQQVSNLKVKAEKVMQDTAIDEQAIRRQREILREIADCGLPGDPEVKRALQNLGGNK